MTMSKFLQSNFPHKSVLSLSNAIIGASVLSMAYCFQQCGIILATILIVLCGVITSYSCKLLIAGAQMTHSTSYEYLGLRAIGRPMKLIVELSSIGLLFGSIVAYQMIVGDLGSVVLSQALQMPNSSLVRGLVMLILTCTISFPLSLSERFDRLTPISIQSIVFYLFFCLYNIVQIWVNPLMNQFNSEKLIFWRWSGIFVSLPIVSLSFSCQTYDPILNPFFSVLMLFVVFSELSDSTSHAMNDIIDLSVSLVGFIYFVSGLFGYIVFSSAYDAIPGNIMQIFPKDFCQQIFLWGFLLNCTTGIPFMVNPTRGSLYTLYNDQVRQLVLSLSPSLFGERHLIPRRLHFILTAIVVFVPTFIAICIPNLEFALALTGATSGQLICYILPAIISLYLMPTEMQQTKTKALMIFGVLCMLICTIMTFENEFRSRPATSTTIETTSSLTTLIKRNTSISNLVNT